VEAHFRHDLRNEEEEHDVDAEQLTEIPLRQIYEEPIGAEDQRAGQEPRRAGRSRRAVEA
jgi:hypothetical protein